MLFINFNYYILHVFIILKAIGQRPFFGLLIKPYLDSGFNIMKVCWALDLELVHDTYVLLGEIFITEDVAASSEITASLTL